jgi:type II secretion system protein I
MRRAGHIHARGFSLFEVILSLGILAGAIAVLGELARLGAENARLARDLTLAHMLCESRLAEIAAGLVAPEASDGEVLSTADLDDQEWLCSVEVTSMDTEKMLQVKVTVLQNLPDANNPVQCSLTRWMPDPNATYPQATTSETSTDSGTNSSSGSGSSNSSSGSGGSSGGSGGGSGGSGSGGGSSNR